MLTVSTTWDLNQKGCKTSATAVFCLQRPAEIFWLCSGFFFFYIIFSKPQLSILSFTFLIIIQKSTFHQKEFLVWSGYWERSLPFCIFHCIRVGWFGFFFFFAALGHNHKSLLSLKAKFQYGYQECRLRKLHNFSSSVRRTPGNMLTELFGCLPACISSSASACKSDFCQKLNLK